MEPNGYAVASDRGVQARCVANAFRVHAASVTSSRMDTPGEGATRCRRGSGATASQESIFFPDAFPSLKTTWQCTKAFDDDAIPSNGALRSPPSLPRSCCAAGTLQDDVPLWPHVPTLPALSRPPHGRDQSRLAPLVRCRARANASRPSSPHGLPGVEGCAPPPGV